MTQPLQRPTIFIIGLIFLITCIVYSDAALDPVNTARKLFVSASLIITNGILIFHAKTKNFIRVPKNFTFLVFIFVILSLGSIYGSHNKSEWWNELNNILFFLGCTSVCFISFRKEKDIILFFKFLLISTLISSSIALQQLFDFVISKNVLTQTDLYNINGLLGHKNLFTSALLLLFPFNLYCFLKLLEKWKWLALINIIISLILIIVLQTRAVWLALFFSLLLCGILLIRNKQSSLLKSLILINKKSLLLAFVIVTVTSTYLMVNKKASLGIIQRSNHTENIANENIQSTEERLQLWSKTIKMAFHNPLTGVGLGNWKISIPKYEVTDMRSEQGFIQFQRPHNDFLWVFSEIGLFGIITYIAILSILIYEVFNHAKNFRLSYVVLFGLISFVIISFFSFPKERPMHSFILSILVGLSLYFGQKRISPKKEFKIPKVPFHFFLILLFVSVSITNYHRYKGEVHTKIAMIAQIEGNQQKIVSECNRAISMFYTLDPSATPINLYKGTAEFNLKNTKQALFDFKKAYDAHPNHLHTLNSLASTKQLTGKSEEAIKYYQKALDISPNFEHSLLNLSAVYYNLGKIDLAFHTISKCDKNSKNPQYRTYLNAILPKYIGIITKQNPISKNKELFIQWYNESKDKNIPFDSLVRQKMI